MVKQKGQTSYQKMKQFAVILLIFMFAGQGCQENIDAQIPEEKEEDRVTYLYFQIVDHEYNDLVQGIDGERDTIKFYCLKDTNEYVLNHNIRYYDSGANIIKVDRIPELSNSGIKNFYLKFNSYPVDSLYIDIIYDTETYNSGYGFDYIQIRCNGSLLEYNNRYVCYYIKKQGN